MLINLLLSIDQIKLLNINYVNASTNFNYFYEALLCSIKRNISNVKNSKQQMFMVLYLFISFQVLGSALEVEWVTSTSLETTESL